MKMKMKMSIKTTNIRHDIQSETNTVVIPATVEANTKLNMFCHSLNLLYNYMC